MGMTLIAWDGEGISADHTPKLMEFGVCPGKKLTWEFTTLAFNFSYLQDHPGVGMLM